MEHGLQFHISHTGNMAPFARSDFSVAMVIRTDTVLHLIHFSGTSRSIMIRRFNSDSFRLRNSASVTSDIICFETWSYMEFV
jgi:hypothetical protein